MCTMQVVLPYKNGTDTGTLGNKFPQHKLFTSHHHMIAPLAWKGFRNLLLSKL